MLGIRTAFCCFATQFRRELPLRNCGAENNNRALALSGQLVTFLIIDAVSPGYWAHVVIYFAADKEAARCTTT